MPYVIIVIVYIFRGICPIFQLRLYVSPGNASGADLLFINVSYCYMLLKEGGLLFDVGRWHVKEKVLFWLWLAHGHICII